MSTLTNGVGNKAVDSNEGQNQRDSRENGKQDHGETALGQRVRNHFVHGFGSIDGHILIELPDNIPNCRNKALRTVNATYDEEHVLLTGRFVLKAWHVVLHLGFDIESQVLYMSDDPYDFAPKRLLPLTFRIECEMLADRITIRPIPPCDLIVDDSYRI